jgi:hypothetical protein
MQTQVLEKDDLQSVGFDWSKLKNVNLGEIGIRFSFGAAIALVAAVVGSLAGAKVGGLFLAFPAILPASLTLIEKKEGMTRAWTDASGGILGSVGMAAFALTVILLLRRNPVLALALALVVWALIASGLYFLFRVTGLFLRSDHLLAKKQ